MGWLLAAAFLAYLSASIDRVTPVEIYSDGGRIHTDVAGSVLSTPRVIENLSALEIFAKDSIDPPGGLWITVSDPTGVVLREQLPRRFQTPRGEIVPLGDWEIDEGSGWGSVWRRDIDISSPFTIKASFRGRFLHDLTLVLEGDPTTSIAFRRGLINNDLYLRGEAGFDLATTSIDPTPLADAGAIGATFARAAALACFLIACFIPLQARSLPRPVPAASPGPPSTLLVPALVVAAAALSGWVAFSVLEGLPQTPDSGVYLLQADWILDGSLWSKVSHYQSFLTVPFTYTEGDRWLAHYPPGWPGLLALGVATGVPWLVSPLLGAAYILLLYFTGRELQGPALGLVAATLGVISPVARLVFGSMLSHAFAATLVLAALLLALRARKSAAWFNPAGAGFALGAAFGVRPLTAVAVALPLLAIATLSRSPPGPTTRAPTAAAVFGGAFAFAAIPALVANSLITGDAFSFPYSLAGGSMFGAANLPFGLRNLDTLLASLGAGSTGWGWNLFHGRWIVALSLAPALLALLTRKARTIDWLLAATIASVMAAYMGTRGHGLHGFGPRYHFEILAPFFLLSARGFFVLAGLDPEAPRIEKRAPVVVAFGLFFALCLPAGAILPSRLALYRGYNGVDGSLQRQFADMEAERAVIVLPTNEWQGWGAASRLIDLHPDAPILVIQAEADDPEIPIIAGDRPVFLWRDGKLVRR